MRAAIVFSVLSIAATTLAAPLPYESNGDVFARDFDGLQARNNDKPLPARPLTDETEEPGYVSIEPEKASGGNAPAGSKDIIPSMRNGEGSTRVQKVTNYIKTKVGKDKQ
ncbi:hypothetical protein OIDMADRAFT_146951 [Oidiodendron maius Zn]|uniref:Uncharacterized protein n=1 Tax=Oidiodendron maius (strain Zn) TaxID=913774 RepID=A0A0C3CH90_OIDMZ|nr:hypothetical protein OIDMADRAFT_146951 [Oidiodendron maius Zn]